MNELLEALACAEKNGTTGTPSHPPIGHTPRVVEGRAYLVEHSKPATAAEDRRSHPFLRELRIQLRLPVRVWGMDINDKPFTAAAETVEISALGARLIGVGPVKHGEIIGIQYESQKARFRVVWLGEPVGEGAGQIGVKCLDESRCIWSKALEAQPSLKMQAAAAVPRAEQNALTPNRRRYPRYACNGEVEIRTSQQPNSTKLKVPDISLGGCYAETMSPLPVDTPVMLVLKLHDMKIPIRGVVRTTHPSMGMGIAFTEMEPQEWKVLADIVGKIGGEPQPEPPPQPVGPAKTLQLPAPSGASAEETLATLLRLLEKKGLLTRQELFDESKAKLR